MRERPELSSQLERRAAFGAHAKVLQAQNLKDQRYSAVIKDQLVNQRLLPSMQEELGFP